MRFRSTIRARDAGVGGDAVSTAPVVAAAAPPHAGAATAPYRIRTHMFWLNRQLH